MAGPGVGTRIHCDHGSTRFSETFLDWRPFRYSTRDSVMQPGNLTMRFTGELEPTGEGTKLTIWGVAAPGSPWWKRLLLRGMRAKISKMISADIGTLQAILRKEGVVAPMSSAPRHTG